MPREIQHYTIDASGKRLGRIATEAARLLMGKHLPSFKPNEASRSHVTITHTAKLFVGERKKKQKTYVRYSGYPGGKKEERLEEVISRKGIGEALRRAIYGMLPSNKLRKERMKQLSIQD